MLIFLPTYIEWPIYVDPDNGSVLMHSMQNEESGSKSGPKLCHNSDSNTDLKNVCPNGSSEFHLKDGKFGVNWDQSNLCIFKICGWEQVYLDPSGYNKYIRKNTQRMDFQSSDTICTFNNSWPFPNRAKCSHIHAIGTYKNMWLMKIT